MKQTSYQANINNSRQIHMLPNNKMCKQANQSFGCYPGTHQKQSNVILIQGHPEQ